MTAYDDIRNATDLAETQHIQVVQLLAEAGDTIAEQAATISGLTAENDELRKALDECQGGNPDPEPPVMVQRVGACPAAGGFSTTAAATVVGKWGSGASVRLFSGSDLRSVAPRPATAGRVHASWKPLGGQPMTEASVRAACINLLEGDVVTVEHEADVKRLSGGSQADLDARMALQDEFHRLVKIVRPDLLTSCVLAAWRFRQEATGTQAPEPYLTDADLLGVDLDGVNSLTAASYYDFRQMLPRTRQVADRDYGGRWTCPEFGWPRLNNDPNGTGRVAAINAQTPAILAAGAYSLEWFDYPTVPGYTLTLTNERAAWQSFVDAHN